MRTWRMQEGFSLLELMLVVAISMILMGFSVPMIQSTMRSYALNSVAANMARMLQLARYTAIRQGDNACVRWDGIRFGVNADCDPTLESTEQGIGVPSGVTLTDTGPGTFNGMNFTTNPVAPPAPFVIIFNSRGSTTLAPTPQAIYITGWERFTAVTVSGAGRARSWRYEGGSWQ